MSDNPEVKHAAVQSPSDSSSDTFEAKVLGIVKNLERDEETGKVVWPEDIGEAEKFAASQVLRYRDTQSAYTKGQQKLHAVEAERAELLKQVQTQADMTVSPEEQARLDDLRATDPNNWRAEMNTLEAEAKAEANRKVEEALKEAGNKATKEAELKRREQVLADFNAEHSDMPITDELIANEVPPRITKKLENGEVSFEDFLDEVYTYVNKGKRTHNPETMGQPNLSKAGGGLTPDNLKEKLELLDKSLPKNIEIWIDMESGVRTNNKFDLEKVKKCIEISVPYLQ